MLVATVWRRRIDSQNRWYRRCSFAVLFLWFMFIIVLFRARTFVITTQPTIRNDRILLASMATGWRVRVASCCIRVWIHSISRTAFNWRYSWGWWIQRFVSICILSFREIPVSCKCYLLINMMFNLALCFTDPFKIVNFISRRVSSTWAWRNSLRNSWLREIVTISFILSVLSAIKACFPLDKFTIHL